MIKSKCYDEIYDEIRTFEKVNIFQAILLFSKFRLSFYVNLIFMFYIIKMRDRINATI